MNLSFSTRGWGDLSWEELLDAALDMKFTGIEVYNLFKFPELTDRLAYLFTTLLIRLCILTGLLPASKLSISSFKPNTLIV